MQTRLLSLLPHVSPTSLPSLRLTVLTAERMLSPDWNMSSSNSTLISLRSPSWFFLSFLFKINYLFIFGCAGSFLLRAGFLYLHWVEATLRYGAQASHCGGFSCYGAQALERRLSSCGSRAQLLRGMWDLPRPGLEPVSPALAGRFSTTAPPGKP